MQLTFSRTPRVGSLLAGFYYRPKQYVSEISAKKQQLYLSNSCFVFEVLLHQSPDICKWTRFTDLEPRHEASAGLSGFGAFALGVVVPEQSSCPGKKVCTTQFYFERSGCAQPLYNSLCTTHLVTKHFTSCPAIGLHQEKSNSSHKESI